MIQIQEGDHLCVLDAQGQINNLIIDLMGVIYAKYINSEKNKKSRWHNLKVFRLFFFFKFSLLFSWLLLLKFRCTSHFSSPRLHKPDVHEPFKTHHQCRWQPLWNCTYAYFSYVGANSCDSTKTKIYSNEGGLTILSLMHVLHSDCLLSSVHCWSL